MITLLLGLAAGFAFGFIFFRSERAYRCGFADGERFGRGEGYRQAWARWQGANEPLLDPETGEWRERKPLSANERPDICGDDMGYGSEW
jgi:hypothetical protein